MPVVPKTVGANLGKANEMTAKMATATQRYVTGMMLSEMANRLLKRNQRRPISGTEKNSETNAAAERPPSVKSTSLL